ncbi:MAG TPA: helix-turn-helix transcriptional regulator [Ohtaekwangia sp.]|uniref:helix-turn-helix transcriptional regulator n=1 Tax=Ohtaekwangia sp. TaxID=2066019 RepID=UPI002F951A0D
MEFREIAPSNILKPYVACFYLFKSDEDIAFDDIVFPSGYMEMVFNLGQGIWESSVGDTFVQTPRIELWGQITGPLAIKSKGKHEMLGIRFYTHSAAYFLNDEIGIFNDQVYDLADILGNPVKNLHALLLETDELSERISLLENFLLKKVEAVQKRSLKIDKVADILNSIRKDVSGNNIEHVASRHGITTRYLHKLIYQHTGLSPKSFDKINRFQRSLKLIARNEKNLTSIAYDCGYFDQSHFIKDFKSFTSVTPSAYLENKFPVNQVFQQQ